jgi:molybdate-binding protein
MPSAALASPRRVVLDPIAGHDAARVQQGRLARAVDADDADLGVRLKKLAASARCSRTPSCRRDRPW